MPPAADAIATGGCPPLRNTAAVAALSGGTSGEAIYAMVAEAVKRRFPKGGGVVVDLGAGNGNLWLFLGSGFNRYIAIDAVRYPRLASEAEFHQADLNQRIDLSADIADLTVAVETIEHLENPRAFMRELVRLTKPGGWVVVTTPNQLSLLSIACLTLKRRFSNFQDVHYPAHITALLEIDLIRIAVECALEEIDIQYSRSGRIPFARRHYPAALAKRFPRALSDNLLLIGRKPQRAAGAERE